MKVVEKRMTGTTKANVLVRKIQFRVSDVRLIDLRKGKSEDGDQVPRVN